MDKLELDGRVARLERRVSLILTVPFLAFGLLALAAILMTSVSKRSDSAVIATPPMPAPAVVEVGTDDRNMHRLDGELRKLHGLLDRGLIDRDDFQAKKRGLLAPILHVADFADDMQLVRKLLEENIIDRGEYGELKKKILGIDR